MFHLYLEQYASEDMWFYFHHDSYKTRKEAEKVGRTIMAYTDRTYVRNYSVEKD